MKKSHLKIMLGIIIYLAQQKAQSSIPSHLKNAAPKELFAYYQQLFKTISKTIFGILNGKDITHQSTINFGLSEIGELLSSNGAAYFALNADERNEVTIPSNCTFFRIIIDTYSKKTREDNKSALRLDENEELDLAQEFNLFILESNNYYHLAMLIENLPESINFKIADELLNQHIEHFAKLLATHAYADIVRSKILPNIIQIFHTLSTVDPGFNIQDLKSYHSATERINACITVLTAWKSSLQNSLPQLSQLLEITETIREQLKDVELDELFDQIISFDANADSLELLNSSTTFKNLVEAFQHFLNPDKPSFLNDALKHLDKSNITVPEITDTEQVTSRFLLFKIKAIHNLQHLYSFISIAITFFNTISKSYEDKLKSSKDKIKSSKVKSNPSRLFYDFNSSLYGITLANNKRSIHKLLTAYNVLKENNTFNHIRESLKKLGFDINTDELDLEKLNNEEILRKVKKQIRKFKAWHNALHDLLTTPERMIMELEGKLETLEKNTEIQKIYRHALRQANSIMAQFMLHTSLQIIYIKYREEAEEYIDMLYDIKDLPLLSQFKAEASKLVKLIHKLDSEIEKMPRKKTSTGEFFTFGNIQMPTLYLSGTQIESSDTETTTNGDNTDHSLDGRTITSPIKDPESSGDDDQGPSTFQGSTQRAPHSN